MNPYIDYKKKLSKEEINKKFKECDLDRLKQKIKDRDTMILNEILNLRTTNTLCESKKLENTVCNERSRRRVK
jgi:hypothetical protein